ncbi:MAG TPA: response regulator transcription factor [Mariprofundaceae bacterium]|nr:response regulator transcription factor [Mariprofundaceae bacterium]
MRILMVDDDRELCDLMQQFLSGEGFTVACAHDGESGLAMMRRDTFDLAVLDIMMPGKSGMEVLRELRATSKLPVIMLTARGDEMDRIIGLELGADDYVPKPCNPRELAARIRAVLRRSDGQPATTKENRIGDIEWHPHSRSILEHGRPLELTATEYDILACLIERAGEVVSKRELSEEVLGKKLGPFDRALDVHVAHIRKKLSPLPDGNPRIKTVRAVGWLLVTDD